MSLNLGLESLQTPKSEEQPVKFDLVDMLNAETELNEAMAECRELLNNMNNFATIVKTVKKHGAYSGFESLIADKKQLDAVVGCDICTADAASIEAIMSSEIFRDSVNKFRTKLANAISRITDKLGNFVRTTLPFKEKYLKEMVAAKEKIAGKKFDEERFQEQTIASAMSKEKFYSTIKERKAMFDALMAASKKASTTNIDNFLRASDEMSDTHRTSFKTYYKEPWKTWFQKGKVKDLGYKTADVPGVLDAVIKEIRNIVELNTIVAKAAEQFHRLETEIHQLRATGQKEEAIEKRGEQNRLDKFFYQLVEGALVYDTIIRHEMYFATYLVRALLKSEKTSDEL